MRTNDANKLLANRSCRSCVWGVKLPGEKIGEYKSQISSEWSFESDGGIEKLYRRWKFKNFNEAKAFVDKISELAEAEGHHPDITFSYDYVEIVLYTHKAGGLAEEDFILAAKIDKIL
ncbi:MAG: 4a-hydroxytetrahydrobiopterin dehydratase [Parcubacteria group bacterium]|nr:4a-hydroxytetrahydrobiopterin dehydratase [Parcubacteria group bacterium]